MMKKSMQLLLILTGCLSCISLLPSCTHRCNIHSVHFRCVACGTALMHHVLYENIIYWGKNMNFASKNNVVHGDLPTILFDIQ